MNPHAASDLVRNPQKLCDLISLTQLHASSPPLSSRVMAATMCAWDKRRRVRQPPPVGGHWTYRHLTYGTVGVHRSDVCFR